MGEPLRAFEAGQELLCPHPSNSNSLGPPGRAPLTWLAPLLRLPGSSARVVHHTALPPAAGGWAACALPPLFRGSAADVGTLQRLPHIIPHGIVRELTYTGRRMMAAEARECGLINQVFTDQQALLAGVMDIAAEIAAKSPIATVGNKEMLNYARDHSIQDGLNYIATWNAAMLSRADLGEAFMARTEKRETKYADLDPTNKLA